MQHTHAHEHEHEQIGFAADLDSKFISFGRNGNWKGEYGVAFEGAAIVQGLYPALTAAGGKYKVNFGERPFKFGQLRRP
jgi:hypothetical protein